MARGCSQRQRLRMCAKGLVDIGADLAQDLRCSIGVLDAVMARRDGRLAAVLSAERRCAGMSLSNN